MINGIIDGIVISMVYIFIIKDKEINFLQEKRKSKTYFQRRRGLTIRKIFMLFVQFMTIYFF